MVTETDMKHLRRCIDLARTALDEGDAPFGSILVAASGEVLTEDRNRVSSGDNTRHPEFALARWAAENMTVEERGKATVYTSGEHCSMCAAAHGWVGLGRIVYAASSSQLAGWLAELGIPSSKVRTLPIQDVIRDAIVEGPVDELSKEVHQLHVRRHRPNDK
jgi:tRNA(Arg) A34 adenosine deaminase TadA